jgi:hypothetical protein
MRLSIHSSLLEKVVNWVANDDSCLADMILEADGRFQTRDIRASQLVDEIAHALEAGFRGRDPHDLPRLVYGMGRARGGSTSLTNVFGIAGIPAYYQPLKSILRQRLTGNSADSWSIGNANCVFAKETFGPYSLAECLFLPLDALLRAGYPKSRIHVVLFDREPLSALASWIARWGHRLNEDVLIAHFLLASHNARRSAARAASAGVSVTYYVYEMSKQPELSIERLFRRIGESHRFTADCVNRWDHRGNLSADRSGVIFPREPEVFHVPGLHGADSAYRYRPRAPCGDTGLHRRLIEDFGVDTLYRSSFARCIEDLEIQPAVAERLFGEHLR